jgi:hypothetical protein
MQEVLAEAMLGMDAASGKERLDGAEVLLAGGGGRAYIEDVARTSSM